MRVFYWHTEMKRWRTICPNVTCRVSKRKFYLALLRTNFKTEIWEWYSLNILVLRHTKYVCMLNYEA